MSTPLESILEPIDNTPPIVKGLEAALEPDPVYEKELARAKTVGAASPFFSGLRSVPNTASELGARFAEFAGAPEGTTRAIMAEHEAEAAAQARAATESGWNPTAARVVSGGLRSAAEAVLGGTLLRGVGLGARGAEFGVPALFGAGAANQGYEAARARGMDQGQSLGYAIREGTIEAVPAMVFSKIGLGGFEKTVSGQSLGDGVVQALKQYGVRTIQEVPEEIITEISHNVNAAMSGVSPDAASAGELWQTAFETTMQTLLAGGVVHAPLVAGEAVNDAVNRAAGGLLSEPLLPPAPSAQGQAAVPSRQLGQQVVQNINLAERNNAAAADEIARDQAAAQAQVQQADQQEISDIRDAQAEASRERARSVLNELNRAQEVAKIRDEAVANAAKQKAQADADAQAALDLEQEQLARAKSSAVNSSMQPALTALGQDAPTIAPYNNDPVQMRRFVVGLQNRATKEIRAAQTSGERRAASGLLDRANKALAALDAGNARASSAVVSPVEVPPPVQDPAGVRSFTEPPAPVTPVSVPAPAVRFTAGQSVEHVPSTGRVRHGQVVAALPNGRVRVRFHGEQTDEVVRADSVGPAPEPAPVSTPEPAPAPVQAAPAPAPAAQPKAKPPTEQTVRLMTRVKDAVSRVTGGRWQLADNEDGSVVATTHDGAKIHFRPVDADEFNVTPAAWYDSVTKGGPAALQKIMSTVVPGRAAMSRAEFIDWATANPDVYRQKVYSKAPVQAAIVSVNGKMVGVTADSIVKVLRNLENIGARAGAGESEQRRIVMTAIDEEIQHWVWQNLLTEQERTTIRDSIPAMAGKDPSSREVMEAAYSDYRSAKSQIEKNKVKPAVRGIFGKLIQRMKDLVRSLRSAEAADPMMARNAIWNDVASGKVFERGARPSGAAAGESASTVALRSGKETLNKYGIDKEKSNNTRDIAAALEARQVDKYGKIDPSDKSEEASARIAKFMADEIKHEMQNPEKSGVGWYSEKFQRAIDAFGDAFPELKTDKDARNTLTALIAITSDGQKVYPNFKQAISLYESFRKTGKFTTDRGHARQGSIDKNIAILQGLYDERGADGMAKYLMSEETVSNLKKKAKESGIDFSTDYQAHIKMPMAAVILGPKLGAFYANLMGADGYLTMDRWWSRSFNRYRGGLLQSPTRQGLDRFKALSGKPDMSDAEAIEATRQYRQSYEAKGFKNGTEIEKAANTIYKAAFINIEDAPYNASDRTFMLETVKRARKNLARSGVSLSVADIQAILWYYEKRLYAEQGARKSADVSYKDVARRLVGERSGGDRSGGRDLQGGLGKDSASVGGIEDSASTSPIQSINEQLPVDERQTFEQWQSDAEEILSSPKKLSDLVKRANNGDKLNAVDEVALRRYAANLQAYAIEHPTFSNWEALLEVAMARKKAGAETARALAARRLDTSTPEGRNELLLSFMSELPRGLARKIEKAKSSAVRKKLMKDWQDKMQRVRERLMDEHGVDITNPEIGVLFDDSASLGNLVNLISDLKGQDFHLGNLVSYLTVGNLLSIPSVAVNAVGYPSMLGIHAGKAALQAAVKAMTGAKSNEDMSSFGGAVTGAKFGLNAIAQGLSNGAAAFLTGRAQASAKSKVMADYEEADKGASPIRSPALRALLAPALEMNRFIDEVAWTMGYEGALASAAMEKKHAGDSRSLEEIKNDPSQDMVERAMAFADHITLREKPFNGRLFDAIQTLRSPTTGEELFGKYWMNPAFFLMPFFSSIVNLTKVGAKLSPYGTAAASVVAPARAYSAMTSDNQADRNKSAAGAINATAYGLMGLAMLGLALAKSGDDEDKYLLTGSPDWNQKGGAAGEVDREVRQTRTLGGVDISRLDPLSMPAFLWADLRDAWNDSGKPVSGRIADVGEKAFSAVFQRQFLQGISDLFRDKYKKNEETGKSEKMSIPEKFGQNVGSMLAPGRAWSSTYRRLTENYKQDQPSGIAESAYGSGRRDVNILGEEQKLHEGGAVDVIKGMFFPPRVQSSPEYKYWAKELADANAVAKDGWYPAGLPSKGLTPEQKLSFEKSVGQTWLELLNEHRERIESASPDVKLKIMSRLHSVALARSKREATSARRE